MYNWSVKMITILKNKDKKSKSYLSMLFYNPYKIQPKDLNKEVFCLGIMISLFHIAESSNLKECILVIRSILSTQNTKKLSMINLEISKMKK